MIFPGNDQRIVEIEPDRLDAHHGLAGASHRGRQIGQHQIVGPAQVCAKNGFHLTGAGRNLIDGGKVG
jgi:hypothetical protein